MNVLICDDEPVCCEKMQRAVQAFLKQKISRYIVLCVPVRSRCWD